MIDKREQLVADLRRVEMRLEEGYKKIEEAAASGGDIARWEAFWLQLLDEYESIYNQLIDDEPAYTTYLEG